MKDLDRQMKTEADAEAVEFNRDLVEKNISKNHPKKEQIVDSTLRKITMAKEQQASQHSADKWEKAVKDSKD